MHFLGKDELGALFNEGRFRKRQTLFFDMVMHDERTDLILFCIADTDTKNLGVCSEKDVVALLSFVEEEGVDSPKNNPNLVELRNAQTEIGVFRQQIDRATKAETLYRQPNVVNFPAPRNG